MKGRWLASWLFVQTIAISLVAVIVFDVANSFVWLGLSVAVVQVIGTWIATRDNEHGRW